jgi:hypothetical protein
MVQRLSCLSLVVVFVLASAVGQDAKPQTLSIFGAQFTFSDTLTWKMTDLGNTGFMSPDKGKAMVLFMESKDKQCANVITSLGDPIVSPFAEGWFKIASNAGKSVETCIESPKGTYLAKVMGIEANDPSFQNVTAALNSLGRALASAPAPSTPTAARPTTQTIQAMGVQVQLNDSIQWKFGKYQGQDYLMNEGGDLSVVFVVSPIKNCGKVMDRLGNKTSNTYADGWYKTASQRQGALTFCVDGRNDSYIATVNPEVINNKGFKNLTNVMSALGKALKN